MADGWHQVLWFAELGVQIENVAPGTAEQLNTNKTTFAENPTALLLLQQYKDLYDSGCYGDNALSDAVADQTKAISSGKAAMTVANLTFAQQVKHDYPDFNIDSLGVFIIPLADNQVLNVNPAGPTKFIWKGSKHIAEAKQFLNFLAQPESLQYRIDNDPNSPTLPFPGIKSKLLPCSASLPGCQHEARCGIPDRGDLCKSTMDGYGEGYRGHVHRHSDSARIPGKHR